MRKTRNLRAVAYFPHIDNEPLRDIIALPLGRTNLLIRSHRYRSGDSIGHDFGILIVRLPH